MSALVSAEVMDATWQYVGASSAAHVLTLQRECGKHQQELSGFVIGYTSTLSPGAVGLALYAYLVIFQAFKRSGVPLRKINDAKILRQWEAAGQLLAKPYATAERLDSLQFAVECSEPVVLSYIFEALSNDQEDPIELTDQEYWHIVRVLITATECLHHAQKNR